MLKIHIQYTLCRLYYSLNFYIIKSNKKYLAINFYGNIGGIFLDSIMFIGENPMKAHHAGNKARNDINRIFLDELSTSNYEYRVRYLKNIFEKIMYVINIRNIHMLKRLFFLSNRRIFIQYPFYVNSILKNVLKHIIKNNKVILLIHDIDSLRGLKLKIKEELDLFNHCQALIVHNKHMSEWLKKNGIRVPMIELNCFDYLRQNDKHQIREFSDEIAFAGNLNKSEFIKDFGKLKDSFILYGPMDKSLAVSKNAAYIGSYSPDVIPEKIKGSFGLIWDGESIDTCKGSYGAYTRYNNPHKLSLYIASCLPVIVWSEAAIADFVKEEDIGFCVDNLYEIHDKITNMTTEDYNAYLHNISNLQHKVINGYFTRNAMKKAANFFKANKN